MDKNIIERVIQIGKAAARQAIKHD